MSVSSRQCEAPLIPRLAIIDDAEFDQMLYARLIKRAGIVGETISFLSAEEALSYFESADAAAVDVILLDINMPGMSGFDFLDHITKTTAGPCTKSIVVMLTTSLDPLDLAQARSYKVVKKYITKPLQTRHLVQISDLLKDR